LAAKHRRVAEAVNGGFGELHRPADIVRLAGYPAQAGKGVNPLGQVVGVLAVPVPFEAFVHRLAGLALVQGLADPQPACGWMPLSLLFTETADPSCPGIVGAVASEDVVYLIDKAQRKLAIARVARALLERQCATRIGAIVGPAGVSSNWI